jgi:SGNH domain (fused to AT3 domains)
MLVTDVRGAQGRAAPQATAAATPRCFGAAARDPRHPCSNPSLRYAVRPTPAIALLTPNSPCTRIQREGLAHPCAFGVGEQAAAGTIALIGDSHASHWRAALEVVAHARRWHGLSVTNSICAVSKAVKRLSQAGRRRCVRWNNDVLAWLTRHPEVTTVFQSQIVSRVGVVVRPGQDVFSAEVEGYRRMWRAFPPSVKHIIVIRDTPVASFRTPSCVMRARAARLRPGVACALSRRQTLRPDPAAVAASRSRSRRVHLADLTRFFCDSRVCFPVVGGVLVHKDATHITRAFGTTLGPYLLRRVNQLVEPSRKR